ncbi:hypothetical protein MSAN_01085200 [Mycena sanguinolenta]|uniref:MYND-type domain-containing protein n=1 Tax=Mycena sanguinolenta TaxID=230812 RepID=A0A8H7D6M9_9AGAR|nr:hypothetical protein MSAN_01085200 [Mycena sanguinolenta]
MHPAVDIKNIKRLPGHRSRVALAACADKPSLDDFERVVTLMENGPASQKILYLPVFYIALDPAKIPSTEDLDLLQHDTEDPVAYTSLSLQMVFVLAQSNKASFQQELGATLWPRVWKWVHFMHEHREHLPDGVANDLLYHQFLGFVEDTFFPLPYYVTSTPGFRVILGGAWASLLRMKLSGKELHICVNIVAYFLLELDFTDPVHLTEMVDGAGGRQEDLAFLSAKLLEYVIEEHSVTCLGSLVAFVLGDLDKQPVADVSLRMDFIATLRQDSFLKLLTAAMDTLVHTAPRDSVSVWRRAAIRGGLLSIMAGASRRFRGDLDHILRFFLAKLLPESMVYYNVVVAISEILDDLIIDLQQEQFEGLEIYNDWLQFYFDLAEIRVGLLRGLVGAKALKACDNVECGEIRDRSECQRCSGCNSFYYCNRECQMTDWRRGGHRNYCGSNMMLSLAKSRTCMFGFHERYFMRLLVQDDFLKEIHSIYKQQLELMAADPDALPLTLFDYTYIPVRISVHSMTNSPITDILDGIGAEWTDMVSRTKRSRGRMQLHVMKVAEGIDTRLWVTPFRTSHSDIQDALHEVARNLPIDYDKKVLAINVKGILYDLDHVLHIH